MNGGKYSKRWCAVIVRHFMERGYMGMYVSWSVPTGGMWSQLPRLHALSSGFTRVSCYTTWVRHIVLVISHICHKSEERCECLKESSKQQCEVFLPACGGFWLAEGKLGPLSLLSLTEAGNRFFDINASSTERTLNTFICFSWAGLGKFIGCINQGQCQN